MTAPRRPFDPWDPANILPAATTGGGIGLAAGALAGLPVLFDERKRTREKVKSILGRLVGFGAAGVAAGGGLNYLNVTGNKEKVIQRLVSNGMKDPQALSDLRQADIGNAKRLFDSSFMNRAGVTDNPRVDNLQGMSLYDYQKRLNNYLSSYYRAALPGVKVDSKRRLEDGLADLVQKAYSPGNGGRALEVSAP